MPAYTTPVHIKIKKIKPPYDWEIPPLGINYACFAGPRLQDMEIIYMFINGWIKEKCVLHISGHYSTLGIWWYVITALTSWETETGGTLGPRSLIPAWATRGGRGLQDGWASVTAHTQRSEKKNLGSQVSPSCEGSGLSGLLVRTDKRQKQEGETGKKEGRQYIIMPFRNQPKQITHTSKTERKT